MKTRSLPLPLFGLRKNQITTNEQVFRILSRSYPKTVAEIKVELFKEFKEKLSYQAVRKSVLALKGLGAIEHVEQGYRLSLDWLLGVRSVIDDTILRYRFAKGNALKGDVGHQVFTGNSLYEIDTLWGEIVVSLCRNIPRGSPRRFISINHYPWWVPMNVGHEVEFCRSLKALKVDVMYVFTERSASTRWAIDFYKSIGVSVLIQPEKAIPRTHYYNVIGEVVIEVVIPPKLELSIREAFGGSRRPESITPLELTRLVQQPAEITIAVQKSSAFATGLLQTVGILR